MEGSYSARVMWRKQGELESYMYYPGKKARCGDSWLWGKRADDKWHFVKLYVRMNAIGARAVASPEYAADLRAVGWLLCARVQGSAGPRILRAYIVPT